MDIQAYKTAISRIKASRPTITYMKENKLTGKILDYGCGKGKDVAVLLENGFDAEGYDPHFRKTVMSAYSYDTVYSNFVLNVIPTHEERVDVLNTMFFLLKSGGTILVAVRNVKDVALTITDKWTTHNDGHVTSRGTFQKGMTVADLIQIFEDCDYADQATIKEIKHTKYSCVEIKPLR